MYLLGPQLRDAVGEFYPTALAALGTDTAERDGGRDALAVLWQAPLLKRLPAVALIYRCDGPAGAANGLQTDTRRSTVTDRS